jgi:hypothetical protein
MATAKGTHMKTDFTLATAGLESIIDRLDIAAKGYPIKALAPRLKTEVTAAKAESTLRGELNQTAGYKLGLVTAIQIMAETGDMAALDLIEDLFGRTAFDIPKVEPGDPAPFMKMVSKLSKEFSETVQEIAGGLADDDLDPKETRRCINEVCDLIKAAIQFKATLLSHDQALRSGHKRHGKGDPPDKRHPGLH